MARERRTVSGAHLLSIAMVARNHQGHASRRSRCCDCANGAVSGFTSAYRGGKVARMSDHVGVGDVGDDQPLVSMLECGDNRRRDRLRLHLGCQVVGGDAVTGYQYAPLTGNASSMPPFKK